MLKRGAALLGLLLAVGCEAPLDANLFQKRAEKLFVEANPGFGIARREGMKTTFVRGDQVYVLDTSQAFADFQAKKPSRSDFFDAWKKRLEDETRARRRTLEQASAEIVPILKSGKWINVQDLGAIGPKSLQEQIRPWRKKVAEDVFVLIGVPEELLGFRYVSLHEITESKRADTEWLDKAVANLAAKIGTSTGTEVRTDDDRLLVVDFAGIEGSAALVLDKGFRQRALAMFNKAEVGAAIPNRDALILFDHEQFTAVKPVRARAHVMYQERNHPAFRGMLLLSVDGVSIFEAADASPSP
ncbi:MAG: hypothetical protein HYV07_25910 [Deltaproteobacteria bacterium]|nr:hypothetical protein [Deltaproteobacteria bacterium]